jgi:hypothetical protein
MPVGAAAPEALPRESARASDVSPPLLPKGLDALILIREAGRLFAYWQIDENTYARAQKRRPGGRLTLKFVSLRPTWDGALRQEFEMDLAERQGFAAIDSAPFAGALRAVVGLADASGFRPFAIAEELRSIEGSAEPELHRHSLRRRRTTEHEASLRALCRWAFEQMQTLP